VTLDIKSDITRYISILESTTEESQIGSKESTILETKQ